MQRNLELFNAIDYALADEVAAWYQNQDALLWYSVAAASHAVQQGHSCLQLDQCLQQAPFNALPATGLDVPPATEWSAYLRGCGLAAANQGPLVVEQNRLYLRRYWQFEQEIVEFFRARLATPMALSAAQLAAAKRVLARLFPAKFAASHDQKLAAINSLYRRIAVINGGPGTGKTHTVMRILVLLASLAPAPLRIGLAAPTGKAAQRLAEAIAITRAQLDLDLLVSEAIPEQAQTLHRLLGFIPEQQVFRHNGANPLPLDLLVVDEASMIDLPLMARLCRAISDETRLIFLGDANQLPSVAAGSVLANLVRLPHPGYSPDHIAALQAVDATLRLQSSAKPADFAVELSHSWRFSEHSELGRLATLVLAADAEQSWSCFSEEGPLQALPPASLAAQLRSWCQQYYQPIGRQQSLADAFAHLQKFRILCAVREGPFGVVEINQAIGRMLTGEPRSFFQGQPIMVTQNHYGLRLFNGDVGLIWPADSGDLTAWFVTADGGYRSVPLGRLPAIETVFAMTIHKAQGSEYDRVALLLPTEADAWLCRELIYTGMTRAREQFFYLGSKASWLRSVASKALRWSGLAAKIQRLAGLEQPAPHPQERL